MTVKPTGVAAGHPLTGLAALRIMAEGGNAFDGIVAAAFTAAVVEPALTSLGGGGFLLGRTTAGQETLFDFFSDTPGLQRKKQELEPHFFTVTVKFASSVQNFNVGLGSVAVPGNLKGFLHVHERLGRMPLAEILAPAIEAARLGVVLNERQSHLLKLLQPVMTMTAAGRELFEPGGSFLETGALFRNPDLADFLETLPADRGESFYRGEPAQRLAAEMNAGGGLLTVADLANYQVRERRPLTFAYRGHRLLTNPPPSFGGTLIAATMQLMEFLPLKQVEWGQPRHLTGLATILAAIEQKRTRLSGSAGESDPGWLAATGRIIRRSFNRGTTHISVVDGLGNCAAMTTSNGEGSGYIVPGTGIMLNNMMGEDDLHPDGFHASPPGIRVASMMAPTLMTGREGVELVTGSGGSKRIRTAIPQVISNLIDFNLPVYEAVRRPRLHWDGLVLQVEPGMPAAGLQALQATWPVNEWPVQDVYFGGVHTIYRGEAGGDPRRGGIGANGMQG
jgi:gamma-glutamyltranspeptidase/glutathione hydrolase